MNGECQQQNMDTQFSFLFDNQLQYACVLDLYIRFSSRQTKCTQTHIRWQMTKRKYRINDREKKKNVAQAL